MSDAALRAIAAALLVAGPAAASIAPEGAGDAGPGEVEAGDGGVQVLPEPLRGRPRVLAVGFEGADATGLRALVPIQDGAPLDLRDVRDAVRALHSSARFSRVAAFEEDVPREQTPEGWPSAVRIVFVLAPVKKLLGVTFLGHQALAESILHQTANLQVNAEFQEDAVRQAVVAIKAAYNRVGHRQVTVKPETIEKDNGVQLLFHLDEGQATRISQVVFSGELGLPHDELVAAFKLGTGDVLNLGALEEGVKAVRDRYRQAGRLRARVEAAQVTVLAPDLALVTVPVQAGPPVRFSVRGNRSFPDSLLVSKLAIEGDEPLDAQMAQDLAQRLRRFYVQAGFYQVRAFEREIRARDGAVELIFSIDEGPRLRVEEILFQGNFGIPTSQLRERVLLLLTDNIPVDPAPGADPGELARLGVMGRLEGQPRARTRIEPETVFDPVLYARALKQIEDLYKSQGYLSVKAGPVRLEPLEKPAAAPPKTRAEARQEKVRAPFPLPLQLMKVVIPIQEGDRAMVSRIVIEGGGEVDSKDLDAAVALRVGGPFSYLAAEEGRSAITTIFTRRGYFYAKVEDEEAFLAPGPGDEAGTARVEVRYRIQAGAVVRIGFVEVVGQRHTQESLVLELIKLRPGDVLTPDGLDKAQSVLVQTGLFFSASLTPRNPEVVEAEKTVLVQLRERPRKELQVSGGFSLEDGPRASVLWTFGNLFGRNLTFSALARANFPYNRFDIGCPNNNTNNNGNQQTCDPVERFFDVGLSVPRLYPLTDLLRAGLDLIHERDVRYTYTLTKFSAQASIALNKAQPVAASLVYEVGYQSLALGLLTLDQELAGTDQNIRKLPSGDMLFYSLRPSLTLDLRDDPAKPRAGFFAQASGDLLKSISPPTFLKNLDSNLLQSPIDVKLIKLQALAAIYLPLPAASSLVFNGRIGRIFKLDGEDGASKVPGDRNFYLGGAANLRGFHQDALQPQDTRNALKNQIAQCVQTVTAIDHCQDKVTILEAGASSAGGLFMLAAGAELRIPILSSVELALFYDAGNLWTTYAAFSSFKSITLRGAVGSGLRYLTPIGRIALDLGFNLDADTDLGEPPVGVYFQIDLL